MSVTRFEYTLALERVGAMTEAAKTYFISPSTTNQYLKGGEAQLGHTSLKSEDHRIVPTEAGWVYLKGARRILKVQKDTMDKLNTIPQKRHSVQIAAAPMLYEKAASVIIPKLNTRLPGTDFQPLQADSRVGVAYLLNNPADSALICFSPLNHTLLAEDVLGEDQLLLVVSGVYLRDQPTRESAIEDYNPLPLVLLESGTYTRGVENEISAKHHISLNRIYEMDDHIMAGNFLEEGRGAIFLPLSMIPDRAEWHFLTLPSKPSKTFNFILAYPNYTKPNKGKRDAPEVIRKVPSI